MTVSSCWRVLKLIKKGIYYSLFAIMVLGVLAAIPLRTCLILYAIDPKTGFYVAGSQLVSALNILLIILTALLVLPLLFIKQKGSAPSLKKSMPLGIMAGLLAISMAFDAIVSFGNVFVSNAGAGQFITALSEVFAVIFFAVFASKLTTGNIEKEEAHSLTLAALVPIIWAALTLIVTFMHYTTIANISEYLFDVLKMVFILLFLYYHARTVGRMPNGKEIKGLFMMGLPAVLFSLVATLPYYIAHIVDSSKGQFPQPGSIVYVVFSVYILFTLVDVIKRAKNPVDQAEDLQQDQSEEE